MTTIVPRIHSLVDRFRAHHVHAAGISGWLWPARVTHEMAPGDVDAPVKSFAVLGGMAIVGMGVAGFAVLSPAQASDASTHVPVGCQPHVELRSAAAYAKEFGGPESLVQHHYRIGLWSSLADDRWKTGEMRPGRRAVILDQDQYGYKVVTSDGTEGWVSNFQVSRTLRQDTDSQRPCE